MDPGENPHWLCRGGLWEESVQWRVCLVATEEVALSPSICSSATFRHTENAFSSLDCACEAESESLDSASFDVTSAQEIVTELGFV